MKGKDSFKGMPTWKGKERQRLCQEKGGNNPFFHNLQCLTSPEKQEIAHAEESWSYVYDTYWTDDWSGYESYYGYEGGYSQGDWFNWSYFPSAEELTESGDKHSESAVPTSSLRTDRRTRSTGSVFGHLLAPIFRTRTCRSFRIHASVCFFNVPALCKSKKVPS